MMSRTHLGNNSIANALWALLALAGLVLALTGARLKAHADATDDALVWVNDRPITSAQLTRIQQRLAAGDSRQITEVERNSLIRLLIDEELLLQRAESLGVVQVDPGVRKAIVRAAIDGIVEDFLAEALQDQQLEQFYRRHKAVFERPPRVAVEVLRFNDLETARQAVHSAGPVPTWAGLKDYSGAQPFKQLPRSPLPAHMLRRYLGPAPTDLALSLAPGEISAPVQGAGGAYLLRLASVTPAYLPDYKDIVPTVRQEYLSRGRELALTEKLQRLWGEADVQLNPHVSVEDEYVGMVIQ
jgi:parvulin-like peptidyl-prolyl isomerase